MNLIELYAVEESIDEAHQKVKRAIDKEEKKILIDWKNIRSNESDFTLLLFEDHFDSVNKAKRRPEATQIARRAFAEYGRYHKPVNIDLLGTIPLFAPGGLGDFTDGFLVWATDDLNLHFSYQASVFAMVQTPYVDEHLRQVENWARKLNLLQNLGFEVSMRYDNDPLMTEDERVLVGSKLKSELIRLRGLDEKVAGNRKK